MWQAWHLGHWTGSGGALGLDWSPVTPWHFAWQAWHSGHWAGSGGALGLDWSPVTPRHFAWQAWHLATSAFVTHHLSHTTFHTLSFTHNFQTHHLSHTTLSHTPSFFVTQHLSYTTLSYTIFFLVDPPSHPLSFLHSPSSPNICGSLLEEVDLWGYPVL